MTESEERQERFAWREFRWERRADSDLDETDDEIVQAWHGLPERNRDYYRDASDELFEVI